MRSIFVYEFVTGGGWWTVDPVHPAEGSLCREGDAMLRALAADFSRLEGVRVVTLRDSRLSPLDGTATVVRPVAGEGAEEREFFRLARQSDWTVVIAPEFAGHLACRSRWVDDAGGRRLSPSPTFIALTADKHATAERLCEAGLPVPRGTLWRPGEVIPAGWSMPVVTKPRDGAGSMQVQLWQSAGDLERLAPTGSPLRLESYCEGMPASIALLCGPGAAVALPPCRQILSDDGKFRYLGGETPLGEELGARAEGLGRAVLETLPATTGYVGIDLVLGDPADGSADRVIEVNPRLTTSYIGLRRLTSDNLAGAMLRVAQGEHVALCFDRRPIRFTVPGAGDG